MQVQFDKIHKTVSKQESEIEEYQGKIADTESKINEIKNRPNPHQTERVKRLKDENQKLRDELALTNQKIEEYISEVSTQLSQAEQWLSEHVDEQPWMSEDDLYQQALLQYNLQTKPVKASTGGSSKLRTRPN